MVSNQLRLLSIDARAFARDRAALPRVIESANADIACVHGAPHLLRWRSKCAAIGRRAGLVVVTGGRPAGANLLLSTLAVDVVTTADAGFVGGSRLHRPGAALACLRLRGQDLVLISATLIGNAPQRIEQARALQKAIEALVGGLAADRPPTLISVEGADRPGTAAWQMLADGRTAAAGRIFVDAAVQIAELTELSGGTPTRPAVVAELSL